MRISDWSSDVCSSDLLGHVALVGADLGERLQLLRQARLPVHPCPIGGDLLARAELQDLIEALRTEGLLHGVDEADGEFGVAVREEAVSGGGQSPQLRRAADRDRKSTRLNSSQ